MKKLLFICFIVLTPYQSIAQIKLEVLETISDLGFWSKNVVPIYSDSNSSSFLIRVKEAVKPHYHEFHTEHIYVVNGSAEVHLGDSIMNVKSGDLIVIPPNTIHSVKVRSREPFEVLSIQSPEFLGNDRVWVK